MKRALLPLHIYYYLAYQRLIKFIMKVFIFSMISLCVAVSSFGQTKSLLTGKITEDGSGIPLTGATIRIHDVNRDAVSDASGLYKTSSMPVGKYLVEVSFICHETIVETVDINGNTEKNFS